MFNNEEKISRLDFLKKGSLGLLGLFAVVHTCAKPAEAATVKDNLTGGGSGTVIGTTAPTNTKKLWIDTSSGRGVMKYWNGSAWSPTASVWDE